MDLYNPATIRSFTRDFTPPKTYGALYDQTLATYCENAADFAKRYGEILPMHHDVALGFALIFNPCPNVLELGPGIGREATEILKCPIKRYMGYDISRGMLEIAREQNPTGQFMAVDFLRQPFPSELQLIFAFDSLIHLDRTQLYEIIAKAANVLDSGGVFYLSLKEGEYHHELQVDDIGTRQCFYYQMDDVAELAAMDFTVAYSERYEFRESPRFKMALRKI